jgi:hypothetical protein
MIITLVTPIGYALIWNSIDMSATLWTAICPSGYPYCFSFLFLAFPSHSSPLSLFLNDCRYFAMGDIPIKGPVPPTLEQYAIPLPPLFLFHNLLLFFF